jgi:hypothetical protein
MKESEDTRSGDRYVRWLLVFTRVLLVYTSFFLYSFLINETATQQDKELLFQSYDNVIEDRRYFGSTVFVLQL